MSITTWATIIGLALSALALLAGCLRALLKLTWQASVVMSRLIAVEASIAAMSVRAEEAMRAVGCIEQLEEGYSRLRAEVVVHGDRITSLRTRLGAGDEHFANGSREAE